MIILIVLVKIQLRYQVNDSIEERFSMTLPRGFGRGWDEPKEPITCKWCDLPLNLHNDYGLKLHKQYLTDRRER